jgi:hypothetical protein
MEGGESLQESVQHLIVDVQRLSVHASSVSSPITFTLVFKRVTWTTVAVTAFGLVTSFIVGIVRSSVV